MGFIKISFVCVCVCVCVLAALRSMWDLNSPTDQGSTLHTLCGKRRVLITDQGSPLHILGNVDRPHIVFLH